MTASLERKFADRVARVAPMPLGRGEVRRDVGAAEAVDRLLGVADDEEPAGQRLQPGGVVARLPDRVGRQPDGDLELDRVGVLELVEQQPLVALVEAAARPVVGGQQAPRQDQQVVELERPGRRPSLGAVEHEPAADRAHHRLAVPPPRRQVVVDEAGERGFLVAQCLQRRRATVVLPVRCRAEAARLADPVAHEAEAGEQRADGRRGADAGEERGDVTQGALLAVVGRHRDRGQGGDAGEQGIAGRRPRGRDEVDAVLDEVPVVLEVGDDAPQPVRAVEAPPRDQLHELGGRQAGHDLACGVVEELVEEVLEALLDGELALQVVEHGEPRRQAGFDRQLEQDAAGEGVERADGGVVEGVEGGPPRCCRGSGAELAPEAVAELGCRLLGERDGGDGVDRDALVDEREDAPDEGSGLAGAGTGLHEEGRAGGRADELPGRLVRWLVLAAVEQAELLGHDVRPGSAGSAGSPNHGASSGSRRLRSHSAQRPAVPSPSGSQNQHGTYRRQPGCAGRGGK